MTSLHPPPPPHSPAMHNRSTSTPLARAPFNCPAKRIVILQLTVAVRNFLFGTGDAVARASKSTSPGGFGGGDLVGTRRLHHTAIDRRRCGAFEYCQRSRLASSLQVKTVRRLVWERWALHFWSYCSTQPHPTSLTLSSRLSPAPYPQAQTSSRSAIRP